MVSDPNCADWPTFTVSTAFSAFTLSSTCSMAVACGSHVLGGAAAGGAPGTACAGGGCAGYCAVGGNSGAAVIGAWNCAEAAIGAMIAASTAGTASAGLIDRCAAAIPSPRPCLPESGALPV